MTEQMSRAQVIAALERQRDEIERAIAVVRALPEPGGDELGEVGVGSPSTSASNGASALRPHMFFGMKAPEAVRAYLAAVKETRTAAKIASDVVSYGWNTTSDSPPNIIRTALVRLAESGEVVKVKGKEWGLVSWFPGLSKGKKAPTPSENKPSDKHADKGSKKPRSRYNAFLAERMAQGMSMRDAAAAWRKAKEG